MELEAINKETSLYKSQCIVENMKQLTRKVIGERTGKYPVFCEGMVKLKDKFKHV